MSHFLITDSTVIQFCKEHPTFDPNVVLRNIVDMYQKISDTTSFTESSVNGMLSHLKDEICDLMHSHRTELQKEVTSSVTTSTMQLLNEVKTGNINLLQHLNDGLKMYFQLNTNTLEQTFRSLSNSEIIAELDKIKTVLGSELNLARVKVVEDFVNRISQVVNPIILGRLNDIHEQGTRSDTNVEFIRMEISSVKLLETKLESLMDTFNNYVNRLKIPSVKGLRAENELAIFLQRLYPQHEVEQIPSKEQKGKMDIILKRDGFPDILFESKDYKNNVTKNDVEKFERDIKLSGRNGIMIAPYSGICNKENFQLAKISNNFAFYLCNNGLDGDSIRNAVTIIYHLANILPTSKTYATFTLQEIQKLNELIQRNSSHVAKIKDALKIALEQCEHLLLQDISTIINETTPTQHECKECGKICKTKAGLKKHETLHS